MGRGRTAASRLAQESFRDFGDDTFEEDWIDNQGAPHIGKRRVNSAAIFGLPCPNVLVGRAPVLPHSCSPCRF